MACTDARLWWWLATSLVNVGCAVLVIVLTVATRRRVERVRRMVSADRDERP